jgi:hypothetical protein
MFPSETVVSRGKRLWYNRRGAREDHGESQAIAALVRASREGRSVRGDKECERGAGKGDEAFPGGTLCERPDECAKRIPPRDA